MANTRKYAVATLAFISLAMGSAPKAADQAQTGPIPAPQSRLVLRVLGPDHEPVSGAKVGTGLNLFEDSQGHPPQIITMWLRGRQRSWPYISDAEGQIVLSGDGAEHKDFYALYSPRGWVGRLRMREGISGGRADIHLEPACRVHGKLTSQGLNDLGHSPTRTTAFLYDSQGNMLMYFVSERGNYEFLLPSGSYKLEFSAEGAGGVEAQRVRRDLKIDRGRREIDMGLVDLPATPLAALLGKQAPELLSVLNWKGGQPVQLAALENQVVVLVFWASWSESCLKTMPRLIELHDLYQDRGLTIVAVHDNSVVSRDQLEQKLTEARRRHWDRDLPFVMGLDRGRGRGAAHETYGVDEWPTTIVINSEGKIAGRFHPWGELQAELSRILGEG